MSGIDHASQVFALYYMCACLFFFLFMLFALVHTHNPAPCAIYNHNLVYRTFPQVLYLLLSRSRAASHRLTVTLTIPLPRLSFPLTKPLMAMISFLLLTAGRIARDNRDDPPPRPIPFPFLSTNPLTTMISYFVDGGPHRMG